MPSGSLERCRTMPKSPSDFVPDRGPAKYFHGRQTILDGFSALLKYASQKTWGTIFLIQGAPGAGKSALLYECEKHARAREWMVADIGLGSLWDPHKLLDSLGLGDKYKPAEKSKQFGFKSFFGWGYKSIRPQTTVKNILKDGNQPLLLVLDEAQALGREGTPPTNQRSDAIETLEVIHNGKLGRSVILLVAGLGTTADSFGSLGISRFNRGCLVELGALDKEAERAVIEDWLTKDGGAKGDPIPWIDEIAQQTHGWPQHILSYIEPAVERLDADNGIMTEVGLDAVLNAGRELQSEDYEQRARDFSRKQRCSLAKLIVDDPLGKGLDEEHILKFLTHEYGPEKASELLHKALHHGIMHKRRGRYAVPIPSMQDWLVSGYAPGHEQFIYNNNRRSAGYRV